MQRGCRWGSKNANGLRRGDRSCAEFARAFHLALREVSARSLLTGWGMTKTTTGFGLICLFLAIGCVSTSKYQRKEEELAQLRSESTERDRAAEADRHRLQADIDKVKGEIGALSRKLATVSYERDALFEARNGDLALVNQLKKRLEALGQNVEALTREKGALAASMTDAYARLQELNRQRLAAEQRAATFQSLVEKLQEMISTGQLEVVIPQQLCDPPALGRIEQTERGGVTGDHCQLDAIVAELRQKRNKRVGRNCGHAPGAVAKLHCCSSRKMIR